MMKMCRVLFKMIFLEGGGGGTSKLQCMPAIQDVITFLMYVLYLCSRVPSG